jgi:membrane-associated protein
MIPGVDLIDFIKFVGIFGILAVVFAESGLLIGFFLPGDSLLFTTGFLIHTGFLPVNIHIAVLLIFIAAVLGDTVGYIFGRKTGKHLFKRKDARLFKQENVRRAQAFYDKHGSKTIIIARFIPIVRTFAPIVAGVGKMEYRKFITFNIIGGFLWAAGVTSLESLAGILITSFCRLSHLLSLRLYCLQLFIFSKIRKLAPHYGKVLRMKFALSSPVKSNFSPILP